MSGITLDNPANDRRGDKDRATSGDDQTITIKRLAFGPLESRCCDFCSSGMTSNHYCLKAVGNSKYILDGKRICGKAMCIDCRNRWGNAEDFLKVCFNCASGSATEKPSSSATELPSASATEQHVNEERDSDPFDCEDPNIKSFAPDWVSVKIMMDNVCPKEATFIGRRLVNHRYKKFVEDKGIGMNIIRYTETSIMDGVNKMMASTRKRKRGWQWRDEKSKQKKAKSRQSPASPSQPTSASPISRQSPASPSQPTSASQTNKENLQSTCPSQQQKLRNNTMRNRFKIHHRLNFKLPTTKNASSEPQQKKKYAKRKCCFAKCQKTDLDDVFFTRVPPHPNESKKPTIEDGLQRWKSYWEKKKLHDVVMKRIGRRGDSKKKSLRYCSDHPVEVIKQKFDIFPKGKKRRIIVDLEVPCSIGVKESRASTDSKGLASDRLCTRIIRESQEEGCDAMLQLMRMCEREDTLPDKTPLKMNASVARQTNFDPTSINKWKRNCEEYVGSGKNRRRLKKHSGRIIRKPNNKPTWGRQLEIDPVVKPGLVGDKEVKRRTGFATEGDLLAFIVIVCNGDLENIQDTVSVLSWYEEWFFYAEWIWGRTLVRWEDAESKREYGIDKKTLMKVFDNKLQIVRTARKSWPTYASYEEDKDLRKEKWNDRYRGKRIVEWDNTNLSFMYKPSDAQMQRITYSSYYAENCAKGAVFLQLCGFMGCTNLWVGGSSDTLYQNKGGMFERQDEYSKKDLVEGKKIAFTNILDKGYRSTVAAWHAGNQEIIQPDFRKSDRKFRGKETISSAGIATDRSGNERAVHYSKYSGLLYRGVHARGDFKRFDNAWEAWTFQVNFMYNSVL